MGNLGTTIIIILILVALLMLAVIFKHIKSSEKMDMEIFARKNLGEEFGESEKYVSHNPRIGFYIDKQRDKIALIRVKNGEYDPKVIEDFHCDKAIEHLEFVHDKYFFAEDRVRQKVLMWALVNSTAKEGKSMKLKVVHYRDIKGVEMIFDGEVVYRKPAEGQEKISDIEALTKYVDERRETTLPFSDIIVRVRFNEMDSLAFTFECMTSERPSAENSLTTRHLLSAYELVKTLSAIVEMGK